MGRAKNLLRKVYRKLKPIEIKTPKLVTKCDFSIELISVISTGKWMIFRCKLRFPASCTSDVDICAKDLNSKTISLKSIFMGMADSKRNVNGHPVFKERVFSLLVPYPEQDLVLSIFSKGENKVLHEQVFSGGQIKDLRSSSDRIFYLTAYNDPYYQEWFDKNQRSSDYELKLQSEAKFENSPKFSIVVPLYKTPLSYFNEMVSSILNQSYSNWELLLVNASPDDVDLKQAIEKIKVGESRIKEVVLEKNEGITLNTARGIKEATGDFVCFVDHDDTIEPNCLFEYAKRINEKPESEVLYCDEDKLFEDGHLGCVYFKPDFSLFLLRSINYICHMLTIKRDLLLQLEYDNPEYDGAQDHHLVLQACEKTKNVEHIDKVLYHWRLSDNSTSAALGAKSYVNQARERAQRSYFKNVGIDVGLSENPLVAGATRIDYKLNGSTQKVSIIIPTKDHIDLLKTCIDSIYEKTTYSNFEVIVVENNSEEDSTFEYYNSLEEKENLKVVYYEGDFNFSKIVNFGRKYASGDYLLLLNNDTEVITNTWIENMLGICLQPEVGIVGCKLLYPDDTIQHAGVFLADNPHHYFANLPNGSNCYMGLAYLTREVSAVTAACLMVSATTYDAVGGFNEKYTVAFNDVDFCNRVRQSNKLCIYDSNTELYHYESISRGSDAGNTRDARVNSEIGMILTDWPELFGGNDPYSNKYVKQAWEGAYFSF